MSVSKPYCRLWRPLKGYNPLEFNLNEGVYDSDANLKYLQDERFACQAEMDSSVITSRLIFQDLYDLFSYIEPDDKNLKTFSHRTYELLLRIATEVEYNPWYQSYNKVKHNRYANFEMANLENLMNAMAALLSILYAQIGERMDIGYSEGISVCQDVQDKLESGKFTLYAPKFSEIEQYDFTWDVLKLNQEPVRKYAF